MGILPRGQRAHGHTNATRSVAVQCGSFPEPQTPSDPIFLAPQDSVLLAGCPAARNAGVPVASGHDMWRVRTRQLRLAQVDQVPDLTRTGAVLSDTMYLLISFGKSTPPPNRQVSILICGSIQYVNDFVGGVDFLKLTDRCIL